MEKQGGVRGAAPESTARLRARNTAIVRGYLREREGCTKARVAEGTRLSYATVSTILNGMRAAGEVIIGSAPVLSGGRPAEVYGYNAAYAHLLCVYLRVRGGTALAVCRVYDLLGAQTDACEQLLDAPSPASVQRLLQTLTARWPGVRAVGLGVPGVVEAGGRVSFCDLAGLENTELGAMLQAELGLPVRLGNDLTLTAKGLAELRALGPNASAAVLYFPEGNPAGAGLIAGGQALHGATGFAGEVSFLPPGFRAPLRGGPREAARRAAWMVSALCCTLNPATVLLCGELLGESMLCEILDECKSFVPAAHLPALEYNADTGPFYLRGIYAMLRESVIEEWSL